MMKSLVPSILFAGMLLVLASCKSSPKTEADADVMRNEVRAMARETLDKLEAAQPGAKNVVESAYGHAVFSNFGMKILVAGGGSGRGMAVSRSPHAETFMRMAELQAGLGMGIKKFRLIWVFTTQEAFNSFVSSGWEFGGQATAQAQSDDKGGGMAGALAVGPGVYLYQITDTGLALELQGDQVLQGRRTQLTPPSASRAAAPAYVSCTGQAAAGGRDQSHVPRGVGIAHDHRSRKSNRSPHRQSVRPARRAG
jgi:lipid-binding SYLF domain-containing protein